MASCGVIEHIPTLGTRIEALAELSRVAKDHADIVVTAYQLSRWAPDKEGFHAGGIPFVRYTESEFTEELRRALQVRLVSPMLVYYYLALCSPGSTHRAVPSAASISEQASNVDDFTQAPSS